MKRLLYFVREHSAELCDLSVRKNDQWSFHVVAWKILLVYFVIIFHSSSPISMSEILLKPKNYLELCSLLHVRDRALKIVIFGLDKPWKALNSISFCLYEPCISFNAVAGGWRCWVLCGYIPFPIGYYQDSTSKQTWLLEIRRGAWDL